jgi:hypothetical protein
MKIREYLTDEKFLQDVKFTGETSKDHGHFHEYKVDQMGDGKTIETSLKNVSGKHTHIIKNWKVRLEQDHIHKINAKKAKLSEAIVVGTGDIAGDDDAPTGNILMGRKYRKETFQGWAGPYRRSIPEDDWTWDEWEYAKGMELKDNYHATLDKLRDGYQDKLWRHMKKKGKAADAPLGFDYEALTAGTEESAPDYVLAVTSKGEPRELQKKNLPDVVFKISKVLGQEAQTEDPGVED